MSSEVVEKHDVSCEQHQNPVNAQDSFFSLKRWNLVAMWSWDVECEVCAICRTPLMDPCLKCQTDNESDDCVGKYSYKELSKFI